MKRKLLNLSRVIPIFAACALVIFLALNSYSYSDADLGWHLRVGQDMLAEQTAPSINHYNYTLEGVSWVDHEWLLNLGMAAAFNLGGFHFLHLLFLIAVLLIAYLNWKRVRSMSGDARIIRVVGFILILAGVWASSPHFGIRVQEFGLLMITLLFLALARYPKQPQVVWILPLLFLVWANIHGSFLLGLAILFAFWIYIWLKPFLARLPFLRPFIATQEHNAWQLPSVLVLSFLATLLNPYGLGLYSFLGGYANTYYMSYIQEWLGQGTLPLRYQQLSYLAFASVVSFVYIRRNRKVGGVDLWEIGVSLLFFILAFKSRRHFPIFFVASLPLLTAAVADLINGMEIRIGGRTMRAGKIILMAVLSAYIVSTAAKISWGTEAIDDFCVQTYPCQAVAFLKADPSLADKRLFSEYNWGGYLLYSYPEKKIFIDGRMPQADYKEHSLIQEYLLLRRLDGDFQTFVDEYGIDLIMIYSQDRYPKIKRWEKIVFWIREDQIRIEDKLRNRLEGSDDWQRVYSDPVANIYKRVR